MIERNDVISAGPAIGLANLLGLPIAGLQAGAALPPGFHILYFNPFGRLADVGDDGHPRRDPASPAADLPRRMFAGARMTFQRPLRIGDTVSRADRVLSTERKDGRSGALMFLRQSVTVSNDSGVCLTEEQTIVYRGAGSPSATAPPLAEDDPDRSIDFRPDEVTLFRFSALSGNSHRIHYDRPYATGVEGYPALVVHGPLIALHLLALAAEIAGDPGVIASFAFRAVSPLFLGDAARLCATVAPGAIRLWAEKEGRVLCMTAEARLR